MMKWWSLSHFFNEEKENEIDEEKKGKGEEKKIAKIIRIRQK